jgi:hypothetical protein
MELPGEDQAGNEGAEDLSKDVVRGLPPWKVLPDGMAKQMAIAGLKWPPDVGPQVMMAKAMPMA